MPAGKRLVVDHISVLAGVSTGGQPNYLTFGEGAVINSGNIATVTPAFVATITQFGVTFWAMDRPARVYYEAGTAPRLKISATAAFGFPGEVSLHL